MKRLLAALGVAALVLVACGDGAEDEQTTGDEPATATEFVAQVASFELVAGHEQRFTAGITGRGSGTVVSFGEVDLEFFYLGTRDAPVEPPQKKADAKAAFLAVAGKHAAADSGEQAGPREVRPSEGVGVYEARGVTFDAAGNWGLRVKAVIDGKAIALTSGFAVRAEPRVPFPGQQAPRTDNPTIATHGEHAKALDSRAGESEAVPDPELHGVSVAAALDAGRPVVVVVSTPVYCVSQFCGPITDVVQSIAKGYGDRVAFVHLEVWEDFEARKLNTAAREWVQPGGAGDLQEPWVFLVDGGGVVQARFDNVVDQEQLEAAVGQLAGQ